MLAARNAVDNDTGVGGRFTFNFSANFALDSQFDFCPLNNSASPGHNAITASQDGGRRLAELTALKAGRRRQGLGLFGKARSGVISFDGVPRLNAAGQFDRPTHFALDLGAMPD